MNPKIENLYQEIGQSVLDVSDSLSGKLLVYAEVQDGVISSGIFYMEKEGSVRFRLCQKLTKNLIYSLWEQWKEEAGNSEWRVLCYVIDNGKFSIDLTYPDQIKKDEMASDRRPRAIKKYFGDAEVNYSRPS